MMPREKGPKGGPVDPRQWDWFLPAIVHDGGVEASLLAVKKAEEEKARFAEALARQLCAYRGKSTDSLSELSRRTRALAQTLAFRMGILQPDRESAWFRTGITAELGPFPSSLLSEPVFLPFDPEDALPLGEKIAAAWRERRATDLPFRIKGPCLWLTLLEINHAWETVVRLPEPFRGMRLDALPEGLAAGLDSPLLRAFLTNVRAKALDARRELDECHAMLDAPSRAFLARQARLAPVGPRTRPSATYRQSAESMREKFRERRHERQARNLPSDRDRAALTCLAFEDWPSPDDLKKRYRDMARRLHPDAGNDDDAAFQDLSSAYQHLTKRLQELRREGAAS